MSGCFTVTQVLPEKRFDTLNELKAAAGDNLLYPADLPPYGFEQTHSEISGYDDHATWNYRIILRNDKFANHSDGPDLLRQNAPKLAPDEGSPAIACVFIYAFVPRSPHIQGGKGTQWPNMWEEIEAYERYEQLAGGDAWEIGGVDVRHYAGFAAVPAAEGSGESLPAHTVASAYAGFMRNGLLYMVETRAFGHPDEAEEGMLALCDSLLETVITGMLHSGAQDAAITRQSPSPQTTESELIIAVFPNGTGAETYLL